MSGGQDLNLRPLDTGSNSLNLSLCFPKYLISTIFAESRMLEKSHRIRIFPSKV